MRPHEAQGYAVRFENLMVQFLHRRNELVFPGEVPQSQMFLLRTLAGQGPTSVSGLAAVLGVSSPAVSALVSELHKDGYVHRRENPEDRRVTFVELTEKANGMLARYEESSRAQLQAILGRFEAQEMDSFLTLLEKLMEATRDVIAGR